MEEDSIDGISTLQRLRDHFKMGGGIRLHIHNATPRVAHQRNKRVFKRNRADASRIQQHGAIRGSVLSPKRLFTLPTVPNTFELQKGKTAVITKNGEAEVIKDVLEYGFTGEMYKIFTSTR
jgi:hypothetical protein